jgi:hypothetical protein
MFRPELTYIDRKGSGEPIIDWILGEDCRGKAGSIMEYIMDASNDRPDKEDLVSNALVLMEQERVKVRKDLEINKQFMNWAKEKTVTGNYRYDHPPGEHDDIVIAVLLAWKAAEDANEVNVRVVGGHTTMRSGGGKGGEADEDRVFGMDENEVEALDNRYF